MKDFIADNEFKLIVITLILTKYLRINSKIEILRRNAEKTKTRWEKKLLKAVLAETKHLSIQNIEVIKANETLRNGRNTLKQMNEASFKTIGTLESENRKLEFEVEKLKLIIADLTIAKLVAPTEVTDKVLKDKFVDLKLSHQELQEENLMLKRENEFIRKERNHLYNNYTKPKLDKAETIIFKTKDIINEIKYAIRDNKCTFNFIIDKLSEIIVGEDNE